MWLVCTSWCRKEVVVSEGGKKKKGKKRKGRVAADEDQKGQQEEETQVRLQDAVLWKWPIWFDFHTRFVCTIPSGGPSDKAVHGGVQGASCGRLGSSEAQRLHGQHLDGKASPRGGGAPSSLSLLSLCVSLSLYLCVSLYLVPCIICTLYIRGN